MVYYCQQMELEVISERFRGKVNSVAVCRNRLSPAGALYTLLIVHDRTCARKMLQVMENGERSGESPCITYLTRNEELVFVFPYREERKFSSFARGQAVSSGAAESIAINTVMACMSSGIPWPLLYLILEQDCVQISRENGVYFTMNLDLKDLDPEKDERRCAASCAHLLLELLDVTGGGKRGKQLRSYELIRKKSSKNAYGKFPELYQDIKLTAKPAEKPALKNRIKGIWRRNRDRAFRFLLVVCILLVVTALAMLVTQLIFGDIPWLRLFRHTFDVIGTENLHIGGSL